MTELRKQINNIVEEKRTKIIPENIKTGIQVFDIEGTFSSDATATKQDIFLGKTAYVNGEKIEGIFDINNEIIVSATEPIEETRKKIWIQKNVRNLLGDFPLFRGAYNAKSSFGRVFYYGNPKLEKGKTYIFNTTLSTTYQFAIALSSKEFPNGGGNLYLDTGWQNLNSCPFSFTASQDCYFGFGIRKADNSEFKDTTDEVGTVDSYSYQLEEGTIATDYEGRIKTKFYLLNENDKYIEI